MDQCHICFRRSKKVTVRLVRSTREFEEGVGRLLNVCPSCDDNLRPVRTPEGTTIQLMEIRPPRPKGNGND